MRGEVRPCAMRHMHGMWSHTCKGRERAYLDEGAARGRQALQPLGEALQLRLAGLGGHGGEHHAQLVGGGVRVHVHQGEHPGKLGLHGAKKADRPMGATGTIPGAAREEACGKMMRKQTE